MSGPAEYIFYAAAAMTVGAAILVAILPNILYAAVALLSRPDRAAKDTNDMEEGKR